MKTFSLALLVGALAISSFAQETKNNPAAGHGSTTNQTSHPVAAFLVSAGVISAPFVLTNGYISQPEQTEVAAGGKAIFNFTITNAGDYIIKGMVNAPEEDANSFYLNIDADPEDPMMIWDVEVTTGFEERPVNWRGSGDAGNVEFAAKHFKLSPGPHKLIVVGREPALLKSISIYPAKE